MQNVADRVIAKAGRRDHISPFLFKRHWLPVDSRIKYTILLLTYCAPHGLASTYITELLVPYTPSRTLSVRAQSSFWYSKSTDLKTSVPAVLKLRLQILTSFRRSLKTHLFRQAFGDMQQLTFSLSFECSEL